MGEKSYFLLFVAVNFQNRKYKRRYKRIYIWLYYFEFSIYKKYAKVYDIRLSKDDKRKCAWVLFKRCKIIIDRNKEYYNKVIYNMDDDDEKDFFEEYLKLNKLNSPQKFSFEY